MNVSADQIARLEKDYAIWDRRQRRPISYWRRIGEFLVERLSNPRLSYQWRSVLLQAESHFHYSGNKLGPLGPDFCHRLKRALLVQIRAITREIGAGEEHPQLLYAVRAFASLASQQDVSEILDLLDARFHPGIRFMVADALSAPFYKIPEGSPAANLVGLRAEALLDEICKPDDVIHSRSRRACHTLLKAYAFKLALVTGARNARIGLEYIKADPRKWHLSRLLENSLTGVVSLRPDLLPIFEEIQDLRRKAGSVQR